jgi:hypothetical protein
VVGDKREWTNSLKIKFSDVILADNK